MYEICIGLLQGFFTCCIIIVTMGFMAWVADRIK